MAYITAQSIANDAHTQTATYARVIGSMEIFASPISAELCCATLLGSIVGSLVSWYIYSRYLPYREDKLLELALSAGSRVRNGHHETKLDFRSARELESEQFTRNIQFFGEPSQTCVFNARVVIVGVGGVGSHCAVTLARRYPSHLATACCTYYLVVAYDTYVWLILIE